MKISVISWETTFIPLIVEPKLTHELDVNTNEGREKYKKYLESYNNYKKFKLD